MKLITAYQTKNPCYTAAQKMTPAGIVVHSTGANNPYLKRYVYAPDELGKNLYGNHWNRNVKKMVHAFIGYDKNKSVTVVNTLPYDFCAWGVGNGVNGSYNYSPAYIQFEICEDGLTDETYFDDAFSAAAEYCAFLCKTYNIPVSRIVSHKEAARQGYASNHSDCDNWLVKHGKTMDWFRDQVSDLLTYGDDSDRIEVGEIVNFTGGFHYSNANAASGKIVKASKAKVMRIYAGKHPYLLRAVNDAGQYINGVYGWVNDDKVSKIADFKPYKVKVTASALNIRKGAGTNYATNGVIKGKGVYTIVAESSGKGATLWGKLKSGAGWISLDYTTKKF